MPSTESPSSLSYEFTVPYGGSGQISVINNGTQPVSLGSFSFISNANITGAPWGSLYAYGANLTSTLNSDGLTYTYNLTEPNSGVQIPAGGSVQLSYGYTTCLGPLNNIGMNPAQVNVTLANNTVPMVLPIMGTCIGDDCEDPLPGRVLAGYYTDWDQYSLQFHASQIPVRMANRIIYAFIDYDVNGNVYAYDPNSDGEQLPAISQLRQQYPYLHAALAFGGWTLSNLFSPMTANPTALNNFIANAVAAMKQTNFDEIIIDWEYPTDPQDATNYAKLLAGLRAALDAQGKIDGKKYYLSIAAPAGIDKIQAIQKNDPQAWGIIQQSIDYAHLMTYDYHGAWDQISDHMSAVQTDPNDPNASNPVLDQYNVDDSIKLYQELGFNNSQLVIGYPAYWRTEFVTSSANNGLYQNTSGTTPNGQFDNTGVFNYACVANGECFDGIASPDDLQMFFDPYCQVPYGYSESKQMFATGDNAQSIANKANIVNENNFAGMMTWTFSGDIRNFSDPNGLLNTAYRTLSSGINSKEIPDIKPNADAKYNTDEKHNTAVKYNADIKYNANVDGTLMLAQLGIHVGKKIVTSVQNWWSGYYQKEEFQHYFQSLNKDVKVIEKQLEYKKLTDKERYDFKNKLYDITDRLDDLKDAKKVSKTEYQDLQQQLVDLKNALSKRFAIASKPHTHFFKPPSNSVPLELPTLSSSNVRNDSAVTAQPVLPLRLSGRS